MRPGPADPSRTPPAAATSGKVLALTAAMLFRFPLLLVAAAMLVPAGCSRGPERGAPSGSERTRPRPPESPGQDAVGKRLPDLQLTALDDSAKSVVLGDLTGKVVLVDFWGPWCPPCLRELPHVAALGEKYRGQPDFRLLAVTCGPGMPEDLDRLRRETRNFLRRSGLDLPTYLDGGAVTRRAFATVGMLQGYPTTFLMDREGVIRGVWEGYDPRSPQIEEMDQLIAELLEEKGK